MDTKRGVHRTAAFATSAGTSTGSVEDAKEKIQLFKEEYNGFRPHSSFSGLTPNEGPTTPNGPNFFYLSR
jgi:transposase InsO family protein